MNQSWFLISVWCAYWHFNWLNPYVHRHTKSTHSHKHMTPQGTYYHSCHTGHRNSLTYPLKMTLLWLRIGLNIFSPPLQDWVLPKNHPSWPIRYSYTIFLRVKIQFLPISLTDEVHIFTHLNYIFDPFSWGCNFSICSMEMRCRHSGFPPFCVSWLWQDCFFELQIKLWIMKVFSGPDLWCDIKRSDESSVGLSLFFHFWCNNLVRGQNLSLSFVDCEDTNAEKEWINIYLAQ